MSDKIEDKVEQIKGFKLLYSVQQILWSIEWTEKDLLGIYPVISNYFI